MFTKDVYFTHMRLNKFYIVPNLFLAILVYWKRNFADISVYANISYIILFILILLRSKLSVKARENLTLLFVIFVFCLLSLPFNQTYGIGSYIYLFYFLLQFFIIHIIELNDREQNNIYKISLCLLLLYYFLPYKDVNTNSISQAFFAFGITATIFISEHTSKYLLKLLILSIIVISGIFLGESRMSLLSYVFYLLLRFLPVKFLKKKIYVLTILLFLTFGSIIYAFVYTYLWWTDINLSVIEEFSSEYSNKHLYSGRQYIWFEAYNLFLQHPITGFGSKYQLESFTSMNLHNSMIALYGIYGGIIGIVSTYLMIKTTYELKNFIDDSIIKNCFCGFAASLLMGFNETYLINYVFIAFFPIIVAYARINNKNKLKHIY